jgi:DNA repair exonuclease SbcCD ATPase subunit
MSNDIINFRQLHAGIMKELDRASEREQAAQPPAQPGHTPERSGPTEKINSYLARIEQAAAVLQQQRSYMRELEETVGTLENQQAEAAAAQAGKLVQELQRAVGDANARADALTYAIDEAFNDLVEPSHVEAAA